MNKPTVPEIREHLGTVRHAIDRFKKSSTALGEMHAAQAKISAEIEKIGDVDFRDDAAIERLAVLKVKKELAEKAAANREAEFTAMATGDARELCIREASFVDSVLLAVVREKARGIAAVIRPFCRESSLAEQLADKTDAVTSSLGKVSEYRWLAEVARDSRDMDRIVGFLGKIEAVLAEAVKERPNLEKFIAANLTPASAPATAATMPA